MGTQSFYGDLIGIPAEGRDIARLLPYSRLQASPAASCSDERAIGICLLGPWPEVCERLFYVISYSRSVQSVALKS
jgi:hypothetical protein